MALVVAKYAIKKENSTATTPVLSRVGAKVRSGNRANRWTDEWESYR